MMACTAVTAVPSLLLLVAVMSARATGATAYNMTSYCVGASVATEMVAAPPAEVVGQHWEQSANSTTQACMVALVFTNVSTVVQWTLSSISLANGEFLLLYDGLGTSGPLLAAYGGGSATGVPVLSNTSIVTVAYFGGSSDNTGLSTDAFRAVVASHAPVPSLLRTFYYSPVPSCDSNDQDMSLPAETAVAVAAVMNDSVVGYNAETVRPPNSVECYEWSLTTFNPVQVNITAFGLGVDGCFSTLYILVNESQSGYYLFGGGAGASFGYTDSSQVTITTSGATSIIFAFEGHINRSDSLSAAGWPGVLMVTTPLGTCPRIGTVVWFCAAFWNLRHAHTVCVRECVLCICACTCVYICVCLCVSVCVCLSVCVTLCRCLALGVACVSVALDVLDVLLPTITAVTGR